ncbi:MAG TPA: hypothetical protein PLL95_12805, partial [Anaerolineales bacterium]|nr:hypothetical protein [Anaerolineales bacterium]
GIYIVLPLALFLFNIYTYYKYRFSFIGGWLLAIYFWGLLGAMTTTIKYIADIYNEDFDQIPFRHFVSAFLGWGRPHLRINASGDQSKWHQMVEKLGGPATLEIDPGWVVLTETLTSPGKVFKQGKKHFMSRNERIYEIVDLREQEGEVAPIIAVTRDGIPVTVKNVKFNFRIWDNRWSTLYRDQEITRNPYPCSPQAVKDYAYKRAVELENNQLQSVPWKKAVGGSVAGIIRSHISEHLLDEVIAPREQKNNLVREEIRKKAYTPDFQENLRKIGTILRWWDPGDFSSEGVEKQFINNWSVDIRNDININNAQGQAQLTAYEELGRAEAEAELLMSIIHSMDGIKLGKDKVQTLQNLILLHTAQVIKAFNTHPIEDASKKKHEIKNTKE